MEEAGQAEGKQRERLGKQNQTVVDSTAKPGDGVRAGKKVQKKGSQS